VHRADGSVAGALPSVAEPPALVPRVEIAKVGAAPGLWAALVRPRDFDPRRKYPVLLYVYGGPGAQLVQRRQEAYVDDQWLADHGFIVARIDGRGTPLRGRDWERAIARKFAEVPLEDQVLGLQALAQHDPALDLARVGVQGASFGGYMAALAVLRRPDVFKAAVARAPVSDWLEYDTCYTERYLGVPDLADPAIYRANGLIAYAAKLERPLLIVHGTADDNVHFVHALALADALLRAGRPFEMLPLARQTHHTNDPALDLRTYQRMFKFFRTHL
jgi:dipeptidyl-peptidase-4